MAAAAYDDDFADCVAVAVFAGLGRSRLRSKLSEDPYRANQPGYELRV